jgi:hypothetical protein
MKDGLVLRTTQIFVSIMMLMLFGGCSSSPGESESRLKVGKPIQLSKAERDLELTKLRSAKSVCDFFYMTTDTPLNDQIEAETSDLRDPRKLYRSLGNELSDPLELRDSLACERFLSSRVAHYSDDPRLDAQQLREYYEQLLSLRIAINEFYKLQERLNLDLRPNETRWVKNWNQFLNNQDAIQDLLFQIRKLIDWKKIGGVKVFVEKCPTAYSLFGRNVVADGRVFLENTRQTSSFVDFRVLTRQDGVITGDQYVSRELPASSTASVSIYASDLSDATSGGESFPPICEIIR